MTRAQLKAFFTRGSKPTSGQFASWIDSFWHKDEDSIPINKVANLSTTLAGKVSNEDLQNEATTRATADEDLQMQIDDLANSGVSFDMTNYIANAPLYDNEAAAVSLADYRLYKTSTGELRYKLPAEAPVTPEPPTGGEVDNELNTFTFLGGEI
ncbi:hypothetical protein MTO98_26515 [Mucilaginibacter sp. SMC90]|uniref:hypothetical protein n=1 Tax=Mucilaginibacter sp. SMC90 TaxID=2929803 RepID=UPI001FB56A26|nr:hypothetical protein [Mucilaginibacter sp. SMC90]UOE47968.1 hypothetical protein MTO98_26515 [Mucilaginibacter sp. SMC90]